MSHSPSKASCCRGKGRVKKRSAEERQTIDRIRRYLIGRAVHFNHKIVTTTVSSILRRLRSRPSAVNAFVRAIHSKNFASECVPIERTLDGRSQFGDMKVSAPLHIYSVFRFPAVQKHQFVSLPNCFTDGPHEECINPYHYSHFSAFSASGEIDSESDDELQHVTILGSDGDDDNMP